jgi:chemotaxis protein MotB
MDVEEKKKDSRRQGAGWIMTFADLMSLLMCFFVLLLSFSEMDIQKYKQIAGAL